jgi:hypothetical protein
MVISAMAKKERKLSTAEFLASLKESPEEETSQEGADLDSDDKLQASADQNASADDASGDSDASGDEESADDELDSVRGNDQLSELFDRVKGLLGGSEESGDSSLFRPASPESLAETGLNFEQVERLILKYLLSKGSAKGRDVSSQIRLPFQIVDPILKTLKQEQMVAFKGAAEMGDYEFAITDYGRERAGRYNNKCTYFGPAPVTLHDYLEAMAVQSIAKQKASEEDLRAAFSDLIISQEMFARLGPAINSGRGMFLFGDPGNGKTSIAERVTKCFGSTIWIPRTLGIDGDIIRIFDPGMHEEVETASREGIFDLSGVDQRWVQIVRPTIVAGGELTMNELEINQNPQTKICEAPLQLKSNCGTLVIDDFGRQSMPVDLLLNRWIVPLEKRYDFLNLPSGKKIQVPFDQLIIFSTNLEPKDLVDDAFLRRIPYKIEVTAPSEEDFRKLFQLMAPNLGFEYNDEAVTYLIEKHFKAENRGLRACHPRDLLQQVKNFCVYKNQKKKISEEAFDFAVFNYFSVM